MGLNPSTVHKVLTRHGCPRPARLDRATGRKNRSGAGYAYLHTAIDDHSRLASWRDALTL